MKRFSALVFLLLAGTCLADDSPWEKYSKKDAWVMYFGGGERGEAVIMLEKQKDVLLFTMRALCKSSERKFEITWKRGDRFARGVDCRGKRVRYETKLFETWIQPLPPEVMGAPKDKNPQQTPIPRIRDTRTRQA